MRNLAVEREVLTRIPAPTVDRRAAFRLECTNPAEARQHLATLPLVCHCATSERARLS